VPGNRNVIFGEGNDEKNIDVINVSDSFLDDDA